MKRPLQGQSTLPTFEEIVETLRLQPHPLEGGHFRETYRSEDQLAQDALPRWCPGDRTFATAIYYLITPETFSALHRLASDELFHFYLGALWKCFNFYPTEEGASWSSGLISQQASGRKWITPRDMAWVPPENRRAVRWGSTHGGEPLDVPSVR